MAGASGDTAGLAVQSPKKTSSSLTQQVGFHFRGMRSGEFRSPNFDCTVLEFGGKIQILAGSILINSCYIPQFSVTVTDKQCSDANDRLLRAAEEGDVTTIATLPLYCPQIDINTQDRVGRTALYLASWEGHKIVVRSLLLNENIDINLAEFNNETPLYAATHEDNVAVVEMLLQYVFTEVNKADEDGQTPLHVAAYRGFPKVVKLLIGDDRIDPNQKTTSNSQDSPLNTASAEGGYSITRGQWPYRPAATRAMRNRHVMLYDIKRPWR